MQLTDEDHTINSSEGTNLLLFRVRAPQITPDQTVALTGNQLFLGHWDPQKALPLSASPFSMWEIWINPDHITFPLEYKFVVLDSATHRLCYWEEGENRVIKHALSFEADHRTLNHSSMLRSPVAWKVCGTVVPVFSLRSEQSFGIGDLGDLIKLIDWAKQTNQQVIQVLPLNDTTNTHTWKDSYPYNAISVYALHPLYLNIPMLGELKDKKKRISYLERQKLLNEKDVVDYPSVEACKTAYYRDFFRQEKDSLADNSDYHDFISKNKEWLWPYAAFSIWRDYYHTADFTQWGEDACYDPVKTLTRCQAINAACDELDYHFFIQFALHKQLEAVSAYARKNRILLKGDLPIGVNRASVETWTAPELFNCSVQTGAPPDDFSEKGQNWSFPTYQWDVMERDGFLWWKKRLRHLQNYFDSIRIDHILGFFRIWEIPGDDIEGVCGYYHPALPLSKTEIERYGLPFDERWLMPEIHQKYLPELFGNENENLRDFLRFSDPEHLVLQAVCSTQRKISALFSGKNDEKSQKIKAGLMRVTHEVLFIRDPYQPDGFHPRYAACQSYVYRALSDENKQAFDTLSDAYFYKRHTDFWKKTAINRLQPLLERTEMLVCGEDLGVLPSSVPEVMQFLQILSLELERMPKTSNDAFADLNRLPYRSVCTTSTHDMNPLRAWWTENREKTQWYYNNILHREGLAPDECSPVIAEQIIRNHLFSSSMLTVIPIQDWLAIDDRIRRPDFNTERINNPADPNHYWRYRMHLTLETLLQSTGFNEKIRAMITESGR